MSEEKLRILDLFKEGKISPEETLELLGALDETAGANETLTNDVTANQTTDGSDPEHGQGNGFKPSGNGDCHHLEVTLIGGGDISVGGWDGNDVIIDEPKSSRVFQKRKRLDDRYKIFCLGGADYEIKMPYNWDLTIYTAGGDIRIFDVSGQISGKTLGGDIQLRDSNADGRVHTMGGDVEFRNVTGNVSGTTLGGEMFRN